MWRGCQKANGALNYTVWDVTFADTAPWDAGQTATVDKGHLWTSAWTSIHGPQGPQGGSTQGVGLRAG